MKFKCKINKEADFDEIKNELDKIKQANLSTIPLNCIRKFTSLLECE